MNIKTDFIGEIVAEDFRTAAIFKKYGIDFCCKGGRTIEDACNSKKLRYSQSIQKLKICPKMMEALSILILGLWIFWQIM
jgi:regulator of cell morphogenesis and NO signaling